MARFGDNPVKSPLAGNELIAAEDPSDDTDICITPDILVAYAADNLPLSTDTGNGFMSSTDHARLYNTYTQAQIDAKNAILKVELIGFYIGTVANGYIEFYCHLDNDMTITEAYFKCASGTVNCSVQINGVTITGLSVIAVSSAGSRVAASALNFLASANKVGLLFAANSSCLGFYITIAGTMNLP